MAAQDEIALQIAEMTRQREAALKRANDTCTRIVAEVADGGRYAGLEAVDCDRLLEFVGKLRAEQQAVAELGATLRKLRATM